MTSPQSSLEQSKNLPPQKASQKRARQEIAGRSDCAPPERRSTPGFRPAVEPRDERDHDEQGSHPLPPVLGDVWTQLSRCTSAGREWFTVPARGQARCSYSISLRALLARAAPMAVFTSCSSSGGGRTAGSPSDWIQSSRHQPVV